MADEYFIGVHERELERLRQQHAAWLPETRALWAAAEFGARQHLVDLGSGPGFSTLELAKLVGAEGRVTAIDKAPTYLEFLRNLAKLGELSNIATRGDDVTQLETLGQGLDGVFCRFFLAFLIDDLDRVLRTVRDSLRLGGVFAAMEYFTVESASCSPPIRGFDAHTRAWKAFYRKYGGDTEIGGYLPQRLRAAGFEIVQVDRAGGVASPGHRWWTWWGRLIEDFAPKHAAEGLMKEDEARDL